MRICTTCCGAFDALDLDLVLASDAILDVDLVSDDAIADALGAADGGACLACDVRATLAGAP